MEDLIKALIILNNYMDENSRNYPTACEHGIMFVYVDPCIVSDGDKQVLQTLGFIPSETDPCFYSYKFGGN